ncbi:MAG: FHA domain-containing protein [Tannerellaceae bacterium]|jgi:pSer/pThr/pTyr-binding forkhead associated (FHA) protein|nr:FHA domain-containing protein [Tannerellaceae bacterium]
MTNYRTVVPGMQSGSAGTMVTPKSDYYTGTGGYNDPKEVGGKPIVGFLVSVSRTEEGEFWVLRQGQNVIGSGSECDVVLDEISVSRDHALLTIQRNKDDGNKLNVGIRDRGSSNGTYINNKYAGYDPHQCKNFDKIKIGNYELLLLVFDTAEHGLRRAGNFIPAGNYDYPNREQYVDNDKTRI